MINNIYIIVDFAERYKADCNRFQEGNQNSMAKEKNREIINETNLKNMNSPIVKGTPPRFIHKTKKIQSAKAGKEKHKESSSEDEESVKAGGGEVDTPQKSK